MMDASYYCHESKGVVRYDPGKGTKHFDPWFALVECDRGIIEYLSWFMERHGRPLHVGSRWGAHITFVRGEEPVVHPELWGQAEGEAITFHHAQVIRWDNGWHAWVDVWCPRLLELRFALGLVEKTSARFHLTLGRLVHPEEEGSDAG
jgi:hypothetical protein